MTMLSNLKAFLFRKGRAFWTDEEGSIIAATVVSFLILFVMVAGVFAVGETVQRRVEIQNAADTAAYAGAVVQADGMSRLAALNRALGWTHVMMTKAGMDLVVDAWLEVTIDEFKQEEMEVQAKAVTCPWAVGVGKSVAIIPKTITMNGKPIPFPVIEGIYNSSSAYRHGKLKRKMDDYRESIQLMNQAQVDIIQQLQPQIEAVVAESVESNIAASGMENDADLRYALLSNPASTYMELVESENDLLVYSGVKRDPGQMNAEDIFGDGIEDHHFNSKDGWYVLHESAGGVYREYKQKRKYLEASWDWYYMMPTTYPPCTIPEFSMQSVVVTAEDALNKLGIAKEYWQTEPIKAHLIGMPYFEGKGSLTVGVARKLNNPFQVPIGEDGLYRAFSPEHTGQKAPYLWAATSSRAGYRDLGRNGAMGVEAFNNTIDAWQIGYDGSPAAARSGWIQTGWQGRSRLDGNLMISDFDGMFLPLSRTRSGRSGAWQSRGPESGKINPGYANGKWTGGDSSPEILSELWNSAEWLQVGGGGGIGGLESRASGAPPPRADGSDFNPRKIRNAYY